MKILFKSTLTASPVAAFIPGDDYTALCRIAEKPRSVLTTAGAVSVVMPVDSSGQSLPLTVTMPDGSKAVEAWIVP